MNRRAFSGLRVLDLTHVLAGPACSYQLGLLGAEIIKIEELGAGDTVRNRGGNAAQLLSEQMGTHYLAQNANKRSLALDLKTGAGQQILKRLAGTADVLVENHRADALPKLGLGAKDLRSLNKRLIYCSMSGYGHTGPKRNAPAYDVNIQAASGLMGLTGTPEVTPLRTGAPILDYATALAAAFAVSAALFEREHTGEGKTIDVSMLDTALTLMTSTVVDSLATGVAPRPKGNGANSGQPTSGSFATKDGLLSLGVNEEHQFRRLAQVLDKPEWLENPSYATRELRAEQAEAIKAELAHALLSKPAAEWEALLQTAGVPAARVTTLAETLASEQIKARGFLQPVEVAGRDLKLPLSPFHFDANGPAVHSPPPKLGQHSEEILLELGYSAQEIQVWLEQGVIQYSGEPQSSSR